MLTKYTFTNEQIETLNNNKNVIKCSAKSITYSQDFKRLAVAKYFENGCSPNQIFDEAGFPLEWLGEHRPKCCLKKWRNDYKNQDISTLLIEKRGGAGRKKARKKYKDTSEKIEYLETKIAYLEAENDFLAKLRGLKRE